MTSTATAETVERLAWQAYADACVEHDCPHGRRAAAEVGRLLQLPVQRATAQDPSQ